MIVCLSEELKFILESKYIKMFKIKKYPYIIRETEDLYFVYKPEGYSSGHSLIDINSNNPNIIITFAKNKLNLDENLRNPTNKYGQINRLDSGTVGTIIFAKSVKVYNEVKDMMEKKKTKKVYITLVEGKVKKEHDYITTPIIKSFINGKYVMTYDNENGEPALSEYIVWKRYYNNYNNKHYTLLFIRIYTGITHQIRIHLKSIGHSLVNDYFYDGKINKNINRGKIFLISYIYCAEKYGCSIDYKKEILLNFDGLNVVDIKDYFECVEFLMKKNLERKEYVKKLKKEIKKKMKDLEYYVKEKDDYTIVNIPAGRLDKVDKEMVSKLGDNLLDNKLHSIGIIDKKDNIKVDYVYIFIVKNDIGKITTKNISVLPLKKLELKKYVFTQIIVKLKKKYSTFDDLVEELNNNGIVLLLSKKEKKIELEFVTFKHHHNYELPIINGKILKKKFVNNIKKNKNYYETNIIIKKINCLNKALRKLYK